jgi:hypothetical protein
MTLPSTFGVGPKWCGTLQIEVGSLEFSSVYHAVEFGLAFVKGIYYLLDRQLSSPQTRHSAKRGGSENGGNLRVSAEGVFVAKGGDFCALRKINAG